VTCPEERRLVALVAGELTVEQARALDEHLLSCETCWQAVQEDRAGRLAVDQLRDAPPPGLSDRITAAIELASAQAQGAGATRRDRPRARRQAPVPRRGLVGRRARRALIVAGVSLVALAGSVAGILARSAPPQDPAPVAVVLAMATGQSKVAAQLPRAHRVVVAGQRIELRPYRVDRHLVIVGTSNREFAMPNASHLTGGSSRQAWMASRGAFSMYCVNRPNGEQSMLLVARMPAAELPQMAAQLHLI
jgi:anti-sigma factor RsiW